MSLNREQHEMAFKILRLLRKGFYGSEFFDESRPIVYDNGEESYMKQYSVLLQGTPIEDPEEDLSYPGYTVCVFARWLEDAGENVLDDTDPYANAFILLDPDLNEDVFWPSQTFSLSSFERDAERLWPMLENSADWLADPLFDLTNRKRFEAKYGISEADWTDAVVGQSASLFLAEDELPSSPFHLIYQLVAMLRRRQASRVG